MHAHNHDYNHSHSHNHNSIGNIKVAFLLNFIFTIIEIIGGIMTNSMAILSDALHDLGDSLSLGSAWFLEKYSKKKADNLFSYGYSRFSLLGALINSIVLIIGSILIIINAIPRIIHPQPINVKGMLWLAILGIIINTLAVLRLNKGESLNEKVVTWHLLEDVFGWIAVLIASIVMIFKPIPVLDTILSLGITIFVLYNVFKNLGDVLKVLLQGVPSDYSIDNIEKKIKKSLNVLHVYHTHIWSLDGIKNLLSVHLIVENDISNDDIIKIKNKLRKMMKEIGIYHVTVQIDFEKEDISFNTNNE